MFKLATMRFKFVNVAQIFRELLTNNYLSVKFWRVFSGKFCPNLQLNIVVVILDSLKGFTCTRSNGGLRRQSKEKEPTLYANSDIIICLRKSSKQSSAPCIQHEGYPLLFCISLCSFITGLRGLSEGLGLEVLHNNIREQRRTREITGAAQGARSL